MFLKDYYPKLNKEFIKIKFNGIAFDSRKIKKNYIFFALKGNNLDGNKFIKDAIKKGSKIIISAKAKEGFKNNVLYLKNKNPRKLLSEFATKINNKRPNNLIAVTGTNGKSSIANFYYQILKLNKRKVASIGTLGISGINYKKNISNTTYDPIELNNILRILKKKKINNVILEASSHGLKQHRLNGIIFKTAIFTNLSRDHLDYHKTYKDYFNSKLILFKKLLKNKGNIIFDDKIEQAKHLNKISKDKKLNKYCFGDNNSFVFIYNIKKLNNKKKVDFIFNKKKYSFETELIGEIQIKNLLFAILAAYLSKIKIENIFK